MIGRTHRFDQVASTMDLLHEMAGAGAPAGTVVVAEEQSGGRGSRGRPWHSGRGGLWCSILYRPGSEAGAELASIRVGLALAEVLGSLGLGGQIKLKWPNDVMLGDRKLGGILCEARWQGDQLGWIAAGIGINVRNSLPKSLESTATGLAQHLPGMEVEDVFQAIIARLADIDLSQPRLSADELQRWDAYDWLRGRALRMPASGDASGVAEDGSLLVRTENGSIRRCRVGTVELARSPALP